MTIPRQDELAPTDGDAPLPLAPRSDFTYRTIEGAAVADADLEQSLFTGAILRNCSFTNVSFRRCDLDGTRLERSTFVNCDFDNVDMRSSSIAGCEFRGCRLDGALIADCTFLETSFAETTLVGVAMTDSTFERCGLTACPVRRSSITSCDFAGCRLEAMTLGDCTFVYNVLRACSFVDLGLNAESIGLLFGYTLAEIDGARLVYLGREDAVTMSVDLVRSLIDEYARRRWTLGVALLRINFGVTSILFAVREYLQFLREATSRGDLLKRDELRFFSTVVSRLAEEGRLPLAASLEILDAAATITSELHEASAESEHTRRALRSLVHRQMELVNASLERFDAERLDVLPDRDEGVVLKLTMEEPPELAVQDVLNRAATCSGFPILRPSAVLTREGGSYVETIQTTLLSVAAFQLFLYLLNGCIIQITELRARTAVLAKKKLPPGYINAALQPRQQVPTFLMAPLKSLLTEVVGLPWLNEPKLKGFSGSNVLKGSVDRDDVGAP